MALSVIVALVLSESRPSGLDPPAWRAAGALELALLVFLVIADPGRIDRRGVWIRRVSIVLVSVLLIDGLAAAARLSLRVIAGLPPADNARDLLIAGAQVWFFIIITFGLLFWEVDGGGSAERTHCPSGLRDFAFPADLTPKVAAPDWRPQFHDYLYLGLTNALAFSPTDAMPLTLRAKVCMATESLVSVTILALIVARAVNVLQVAPS